MPIAIIKNIFVTAFQKRYPEKHFSPFYVQYFSPKGVSLNGETGVEFLQRHGFRPLRQLRIQLKAGLGIVVLSGFVLQNFAYFIKHMLN